MQKRKRCLIEEISLEDSKRSKNIYKTITIQMDPAETWRNALKLAEKTVILNNKVRKVHYKFRDGRQMVEEYNDDTECINKRMWKTAGGLSLVGEEETPADWVIEIGDNPTRKLSNVDNSGLNLRESSDQPTLTTRNTKVNIEWRIRNLPYPIETYSIAADSKEKCLVVRTTNKKFFKRLPVLDLERIGLDVVQKNVQYTHKFNTLIILYKKPSELIEFEKAWYKEIKKIEPIKNDIGDCKLS